MFFLRILSIVYVSIAVYEHHDLWVQILNMLHLNIPTLFVRDFNYILQPKDKKGGKPFQLARMIDLEYYGPHYTLCNNRLGLTRIWECIDRAFATRSQLDHYFTSTVTHLIRFVSDHCPLLINIFNMRIIEPRLFWFKKFWLSYASLERMVRNTWSTSSFVSPSMQLTFLLNNVQKDIRR